MTRKLFFNWIHGTRSICAVAVILVLSCSFIAAQESSGKSAPKTENNTVYEIGGGVTPPKGVYTPDAEYSEKGRKKKISGTVVVAMVVMADGKVRDARSPRVWNKVSTSRPSQQ